jgi:hypothetical protein
LLLLYSREASYILLKMASLSFPPCFCSYSVTQCALVCPPPNQILYLFYKLISNTTILL